MYRTNLLFCAVAVAVVSIGVYGCGANTASRPEPSVADPSTSANVDHANMGSADHDQQGSGHAAHEGHAEQTKSDMETMQEGLAELSAADRASAEKQHVCPVSGEMLGTMGTPQKVDVSGQQVWICCPGCKDQLLASPGQYLAKLNP